MKHPVEFESNGIMLRGLLESPKSGISSYALFAHCFTCGKDIAAASRICRALTAKGIAVLRFDFTGLGNSDGDFSNSNYSSAAVLSVASQLNSVKAIATIGAPHTAKHVMHNFASSLEAIKRDGQARVKLGFRELTIKQQFIEDLEKVETQIASLKRALLVMHSPMDDTVKISEAEKIYRDAKHPKSFVSLDNANHLVSNKDDAEYIAATIAAWASRYIDMTNETVAEKEVNKGHVFVEEKGHGFTQNVYSDSHHWLADEPLSVGGENLGPDPYEHLLASLGTCTSMTIRMYANRKKWPLDKVGVSLKHERSYSKDCENCDETENGKPQQIDSIFREVYFKGDLSTEQRERLLEIADKCPVHKTLHSHIVVKTELVVHLITLSNHRQAWDMSLGLFAYAEGNAERFLDFATYLYEHQEQFYNSEYTHKTHADLQQAVVEAAQNVGDISPSSFLERMNAHDIYIDARTPIRYAATKSVWATPSIFVNNGTDTTVNHSSALADWKALLDPLLA